MDRKYVPLIALLVLAISVGAMWLYMNQDKIDTVAGRPGVLGIEAPPSASLDVPFTVEFVVDTQGQDVNAVSVFAHFDKNSLEIINLDTTGSFCQFYPENKYDNATGTIRVACGAPNPGFNGINTIAVATFMPKSPGNTEVVLEPESEILLNDGKGTNILYEHDTRYIFVENNL